MLKLLGMLFHYLNHFAIKCRGKFLASRVNSGYNVKINGSTKLYFPKNIYIDDNTYINGGIIAASSEASIKIGKNCCIATGVFLRTDNHNYIDSSILINHQGHTHKSIEVGNDVWIGYGAVILPGVSIGDGCVIGAGSVVTKSTEPYCVYVGVPAKVVKRRQ